MGGGRGGEEGNWRGLSRRSGAGGQGTLASTGPSLCTIGPQTLRPRVEGLPACV